MKNSASVHGANAGTSDAPGDLALKALRVSESRYRRLFETAQDGILLLNADTAQIEDVNPYLIEMLGYSHSEFLGKKFWEAGSFADIAQSKEMFSELQTHGYVHYKDLSLRTKAGAIVPVEFVSNTYDCEGFKVIQCNIRNISERHADRAKIQRHTQLYAALSQCNKAIVHCASEAELFLQICRTAVQSGGMKMAWIGLIDPETRRVRPAASFGDDTEYLQELNISADADSPFGCGPTGTSIGENRPVWCQDFLNDPVTAPWHESAARAGLAASASLPLHRNGNVVGAFTIYSGEVNSFDQSARELLVVMAADISFALGNFFRESQRQQAEEEKVFKNTILQTQQETSLDGILVVGEDGQIISYNQQFVELWRLLPQLVSTRLNSAMIQAAAEQVENAEAFVARVQYLNEHREVKSREEISLKDGRTIDQYSAPVTGTGRKHYGRVWYFRDITERKLAAQALRESEMRFRELAENIRDVFFLRDADGNRVLYVSPAYEEISGRSRESLYANPQSWFGAIHPDDRASATEKYKIGMKIGKYQIEYRIVRPDGSIRWIEMRGFPVRDDAGKVVRIAGVAKDISERKQTEQQIRQQAERLTTTLESITDAFFTVDQQWRFTFLNREAERLLERTRAELTGRDFWTEFPDTIGSTFEREYRRAMVDNKTVDFEEFYPPLNTWFGVRAYPSEQGLAVYFRDITDAKRIEQEMVFKNTVLQTQQETSLDGILVVDEDGKIISYNQQFVALWRLSPQLVSARMDAPLFQSVADQVENSAAFVDRVQYLYEHREEKSREEISLRDGRLIDRYSAPVTGADRTYYGRVWYFRDITERKKAEQKFKDLLESAPDAMVIVNQDGEMLLVNAQAVNLFGWCRDELLGRKIDILVPERLRRKHPASWNAFFVQPRARPMCVGLDLFGLRKDGTEFPVEISLSPLQTSEGTLVIAALRDITERKHGERLVRDSERRFRAIFDQAPIAIALLDMQGQPIISNSPLTKMVGYSNDELSRMTFSQFTYPEDIDKDLHQFTELVEGRISAYSMEKRYVHKNGSLIWANLFVTVLRDENGLPQDVIGMAEDITERKRAEISIKRLNRVYAVLSGINSVIVRVCNRDELFREACRIAVEEGGFRMSLIAIVDRTVLKIQPVASAGMDEELLSAIKGILSSSDTAPNTMAARAIKEKKVVVSNDSQNDPRVLFGKLYTDAGVHSMAVLPLLVSDEAVGVLALYGSECEFFHEEELKLLTELTGDIAFAIDHIEKQERLDYLAYYDVLTGLANRRLFLERLAQHMRSAAGGHKLAMALIDLERFKNINDSLGRSAGDALLRQVAEWLKQSTGDASLLARVDADHFAVVQTDIQSKDDLAQLVDERMEAFLQHPFRLDDAVFSVAFRAGVALFPDDGADADTLFKNAEAALKKAKASGERCLFYTQTMTEAVAGKLTLENQLRQALDKGEFVLHYQPKVNLASGKVTSAEALIRWNDPRTGLVPPDRFIPILEETGMIYEVGRWALRKAIEDFLRWRAAGLAAVRIAVNVSPLQLRDRGFIAEIEQVIGIDANAAAGLELEITESLIMTDVKHSIVSLQAIRAMGISIAIDDFGTGFSSLSYLAKLPVDTLKIDRSFVISMTVDAEGLALVSTIISLAHALKLKVVAEGVETEEQARLLRVLNCDEMQGYLFSKPVPSDIFETRFLIPPPQGDE